MAATRNAPPVAEEMSTEQRAAFDTYVNELAQLGGPAPPAPPDKPPVLTDAQWNNLPDRQRENWVSDQVGWILQELAKLDADKRRDADIQALQAAKKTPEPEGTPTGPMPGWQAKLQRFLWGDQDKS